MLVKSRQVLPVCKTLKTRDDSFRAQVVVVMVKHIQEPRGIKVKHAGRAARFYQISFKTAIFPIADGYGDGIVENGVFGGIMDRIMQEIRVF